MSISFIYFCTLDLGNVHSPLAPPRPHHSNCGDKENYCQQSYCHGPYADWSKINCQKTCGKCPISPGKFDYT